MSYEYSDTSLATLKHALPDVEVFYVGAIEHWKDPLECHQCSNWSSEEETPHSEHIGYYWVAGFPSCLWDGEPMGPFDSYAEALNDARAK